MAPHHPPREAKKKTRQQRSRARRRSHAVPRLELLDHAAALAIGVKGVEPAGGAKAQTMEELVDHQASKIPGTIWNHECGCNAEHDDTTGRTRTKQIRKPEERMQHEFPTKTGIQSPKANCYVCKQAKNYAQATTMRKSDCKSGESGNENGPHPPTTCRRGNLIESQYSKLQVIKYHIHHLPPSSLH